MASTRAGDRRRTRRLRRRRRYQP